MGDPPLFTGAVHESVTAPTPATAFGSVGAEGTVLGVLELDDVEATEVPELFVAVTVKV
jgi:hypothetical protein